MLIEWWQVIIFLIITGLWSEWRYIRGGLKIYKDIEQHSKRLVEEKAKPLMKESYELGFKEGVDALNEKMQAYYKSIIDNDKQK